MEIVRDSVSSMDLRSLTRDQDDDTKSDQYTSARGLRRHGSEPLHGSDNGDERTPSHVDSALRLVAERVRIVTRATRVARQTSADDLAKGLEETKWVNQCGGRKTA